MEVLYKTNEGVDDNGERFVLLLDGGVGCW